MNLRGEDLAVMSGLAVKKIVILGGSFAGLNAAYELKHMLKEEDAEITVIARQTEFVFIPSLIWVVPGWRRAQDIIFDLKSTLEPKGIRFVHATAQKIIPEENKVMTAEGVFEYDYLLIATGPHFDWDAVPGVGPDKGYTQSICSLPHALEAAKKWKEFLKDPGPVVLGSTQYASCFGAEYEIAFNIDLALRQAGIREQAPITFITSEPFVGHFGIGGMGKGQEMVEAFFRKLKINWITNAVTEKISPEYIYLSSGDESNNIVNANENIKKSVNKKSVKKELRLPFKYAIIIPPFMGVSAVRNSPGIGDDRGFVPINSSYQHTTYPNIYAAGVAVAVKPPAPTPVPTGVPKTGYMSEVMAKVAAQNIAADIKGDKSLHKELPFPEIQGMCILDAGNQGVVMLSDHILEPRQHEILVPGPWSHWAKVLFEKYYLWKMKAGYSSLP